MADRRNSILASCFLPMIALLVLVIVLIGLVIASIPSQAEQLFGPANPSLGGLQRYRLALQLLWQQEELLQPADPTGGELAFEVGLGEPMASVIQHLEEAHLIRNASAFRAYLVYTGLDTSLQAGRHQLSPAMSAIQLAEAMQDATPGNAILAVLAGWRLDEIAAALPFAGLEMSAEAFLGAAGQVAESRPYLPQSLTSEIPGGASLEGFLFPDSYEVPRQITAPDLLQIMLSRFDQQVNSELRNGFALQGLTIFQATVLASIIEREAVVDDEMPMIASVFLNRLATGMKLDSDPTVQYALGYEAGRGGWWITPLSAADLQVESLYNTYLYAGLPPGPIANPGLSALRAVAFPAQSPYYYFRARCDGSGRHAFAETYEQHLGNACP